jgi:hypothetical protein
MWLSSIPLIPPTPFSHREKGEKLFGVLLLLSASGEEVGGRGNNAD